MTMSPRFLLLAASLFALPTATVFAQTSDPSANTGRTGGLVATPDYPAGSADAKDPALTEKFGRNTNMNGLPRDENPRVPGATGRTIVRGDNSTVGSDRNSTIEQKTDDIGAAPGGGGN